MKNKLIPSQERYLIAKRALIELVNDTFISIFDREHSRHRKPENAITNILAVCCVYYFYLINHLLTSCEQSMIRKHNLEFTLIYQKFVKQKERILAPICRAF